MLKDIDITNFDKMDLEEINDIYQYINNVAISAIITNSTESVEDLFKDILISSELAYKRLKLENNLDKLFYLGNIIGISNTVLSVNKEKKEITVFKEYVDSYPLIISILETVKEKGDLCQKELQNELGLKSRSKLVKIRNILENHGWINIVQVKPYKYYKLTEKGENMLKKYEDSCVFNGSYIPFNILCNAANSISEEIVDGKSNINMLIKLNEFDSDKKIVISEVLRNILLKKEQDSDISKNNIIFKDMNGKSKEDTIIKSKHKK